MTPDERALIDGLFDRMRATAGQPRDAEAEALIARRTAELPFAGYALAQTVLVQEHALQQAYARVQELETEIAAQQEAAQQRPASGGSFLGGLFGGGRTSVPPAGARPVQAGAPMGVPPGYAQQGYAQPAYPQQPSGPWGQPLQPQRGFGGGMGGGGFLQGALATAAGVAGGALLYDGIRNMMSGGEGAVAKEVTAALDPSSAHASTGNLGADVQSALGGGAPTPSAADWNVGSTDPDQDPGFQDGGFQQASADDDGDWGGGSDDDGGWA